MLEERAPLTRRERARQQVRQSILDAALEIAAREGWHAVTTRKIAEKIEYSLPTLYEHFKSKAAVLEELNRAGHRQLLAALRAARQRADTPAAGAREIALAYCAFAWQHRELYEVMHGLSGAPLERAAYLAEAEALLDEARAALEAWARSEGLQLRRLDDAVQILWASLHGIAALALARQLPGGKKRAAALAARGVEDLLSAWRNAGWV